MLSRRTFLKGLVATAAGILVPAEVLAEPERRVWALDSTMVTPVHDWDAHRATMAEWYDALQPNETPFTESILRYTKLHPRTDHEMVKIDLVYADGRVEFQRWAPAQFWPTQ